MSTNNQFKSDFPIFQKHPQLAYLDNAASSQTPQIVIDSMTDYYLNYRANTHRGLYDLSEQATTAYEDARHTIADYLQTEDEEIIFTRGATTVINHLANALCSKLHPRDEIIISSVEHHSNLLPWQQAAKKYQLILKVIPLLPNGNLDLKGYESLLTDRTKIVAVAHISNVLGVINPIAKISDLAHQKGAVVVVDACQSVAHLSFTLASLHADFLVFSGHKVYGPTGIGVLCGKKKLLEKLSPFEFGGHMVAEASFEDATWADLPDRLEAGTNNISGVIGLGTAINYTKKILNTPDIFEQEKKLTQYALDALHSMPEVMIYGPSDTSDRIGVISFNLQNIHGHDVAQILAQEQVAVRAGHHCARPLMTLLGVTSTVRLSLACYNTTADIDQLMIGLKKALQIFHV